MRALSTRRSAISFQRITPAATIGKKAARKEDLEGPGEPIFDIYRASGEFRVDYRPTDEMTAILASGLTQSTGMELTGIGAGQAKNWSYGYTQARLIYKDLFAQAFWNRSDARDTYVLRTGLPTVDRSNLYVGQIQHGYSFGDRQRFTYGADLLLTPAGYRRNDQRCQ